MTFRYINCSESVAYLCLFALVSIVSVIQITPAVAQSNSTSSDPLSQLGDHIGLSYQVGTSDLTSYELFNVTESRAQSGKHLDHKSYLHFNQDKFNQLKGNTPDQFSLSFGGAETEQFEVAFQKTNLLSEDYVLRTCESVRTSKFVSAYVSSNDEYKANCLIYEDHIYVNVYTAQSVFRLNNKNKTKDYFLYVDDGAIENDIVCNTTEEEHFLKPLTPNNDADASLREKGALQIYFEIDYVKFLDHNSDVDAAEEHMISIFADVSTFYAEHAVDIEISEIMVWTETDPYAQYNSLTYVLDKFGEQLYNGFNGDLAHLVSGRNIGGGLAWIGGLCQGIQLYEGDWDNDGNNEDHYFGAHSVSGNHTTDVVAFPTYSWNVEVVAHELGHTMGSPHTHACLWGENGDEPLDNCWATEGSCNSGPTPYDGGTIMSFCHMSYQGINFLHGFGEEPGALIYDAYANASCLDGEEIPGEICQQAMPLPENGMLGCDGPATGHGSSHIDAVHSRWYVYEPTEDIMASFNSCSSSENTRLWIYEGTCNDLSMIANNDDSCESGSSMVQEITFEANKTYFIEWDNKWSSDSFNFEVAMLPSSDCLTELPSPILDGEYHVNGSPMIEEQISVNESLIIKASQSIELAPGFEMNSNFDFEIKIEECINP